jgi:glycosyltransferase involved in cell wall biosynthesis
VKPLVLIATPVKDAAAHLDAYFDVLATLSYPRAATSLAFLESDSTDGTYEALLARLPQLAKVYRRVRAWKRDFGFRIPEGMHRWSGPWQISRQRVLARSRNYLLSKALTDEEWVLWIDADVTAFPPDVIERLLAAGKEIVHPHCVRSDTGTTFDHNAWRDRGRLHMDDLRHEGDLVRLDAVGGTMLLVKADVHREGLVFPPFLYGQRSPFVRDPHPLGDGGVLEGAVGEIETEGLGLMAKDMGYECWGMPNLETVHPV